MEAKVARGEDGVMANLVSDGGFCLTRSKRCVLDPGLCRYRNCSWIGGECPCACASGMIWSRTRLMCIHPRRVDGPQDKMARPLTRFFL